MIGVSVGDEDGGRLDAEFFQRAGAGTGIVTGVEEQAGVSGGNEPGVHMVAAERKNEPVNKRLIPDFRFVGGVGGEGIGIKTE